MLGGGDGQSPGVSSDCPEMGGKLFGGHQELWESDEKALCVCVDKKHQLVMESYHQRRV